jgi:hypothetical protein
LGNTFFLLLLLYLIIFEIHVWFVSLNLNSTQILFKFFQLCLKFYKLSKHNFKKLKFLDIHNFKYNKKKKQKKKTARKQQNYWTCLSSLLHPRVSVCIIIWIIKGTFFVFYFLFFFLWGIIKVMSPDKNWSWRGQNLTIEYDQIWSILN